MNETKQTELRVRPRRTELAASKPDIEWVKTPKKPTLLVRECNSNIEFIKCLC